MTSSSEEQRVAQDFMDRFDSNSDEAVTKNEFSSALDAEGVSKDTADAIRKQVFSNWDGDGDARLSKKEIKKLAEKWASFPGDQSK